MFTLELLAELLRQVLVSRWPGADDLANADSEGVDLPLGVHEVSQLVQH